MLSVSSELKRFSTTLASLVDNLSKSGRSRKQAVAVAVDSALTVFSLWCAFSLRLGGAFSDLQSTWTLFVVLPIATVIIFMSLGIYRWVIRSSNVSLLQQLVKACFAASMFLVLFMHLFPLDRVAPRSIFVIFGIVLILGTCSARFIWQAIFDSSSRGEPVAIYGAGAAGRQLFSSLSQGVEFCPVLFIDDSPLLADSTVSGIPVIAASSVNLESNLRRRDVERVILATTLITPLEYQRKLDLFSSLGFPLQTVPSHTELVAGTVKLDSVRDLSIADILGRTEVPPNPYLLSKSVRGKAVLVTGGGGSIGSELCRQILSQNPLKLIVLDHSEENLYKITEDLNELTDKISASKDIFLPVLCSVKDKSKIRSIISKNKVHTVYHAAAYKHVPIIEAQPDEGVGVNIFGTLNVLNASIDYGVANFVLISTDKAVRPTNCMGASKRVAELVLQAKSQIQSSTKISMVRFGNVLGSSGSVVPKFKKQIEEGGPITVTDFNITRYFMTIPEAAQLVMQASAIAKGGEVFVLDMGAPMKIVDLAATMVRLSGKKLFSDTGDKRDIQIEELGLRPGEKMYEELFIGDGHLQTDVQKIYMADESVIDWKDLEIYLERLENLSARGDNINIRSLLLELAFYTQKPSIQESLAQDIKSKVDGKQAKNKVVSIVN